MPNKGKSTAPNPPTKKKKTGLSGVRGYKVVKSNDLIQKARFDLSIQEQKIILYLISKIKPEDNEFTTIEFNVKEFCAVCGINSSGKNYNDIKDAIKALADKSIWVTIDIGKQAIMRWIDKSIIDINTGTMQIKFDDLLKPYLLHVKKNFTQYELYNILAMKSQYSIRLYEILRSYEYKHIIEFRIDDLKDMLAATTYERYQDFRRYVIDTAIKEIVDLSDINVEHESIREGRRYTKILFNIRRKQDLDENFATWKRILNAIGE